MKNTELPKVNTQGLIEHIEDCHRAGVNPGILGSPGIGKTSILEQYANRVKSKYYSYSISGLAPDQVRGFMMPGHDGNPSYFEKPAILDVDESQNTMIAFDEINSTSNEMFAAFFELFGSRRIGKYSVPDNCFLVATGNLLTDRGVARPMPTPFTNRFAWVIYQGPSMDEWTKHMGENLNPIVESFLDREKNLLCNAFDPKYQMNPTPRSWDYASRMLNTSPNADASRRLRIIASSVGEITATKMSALNKYIDLLPSLEEIHMRPKQTAIPSIEKEGGLQAQYYLATSLVRDFVQSDADENVKEEVSKSKLFAYIEYVFRFEKDMQMAFFTKLCDKFILNADKYHIVFEMLNHKVDGKRIRDGYIGKMIQDYMKEGANA